MNNETIQIGIGKRIAECRREKQLTQDELANRLGVTAQALSQYERGLRYPDVGILKSLWCLKYKCRLPSGIRR
ncbi:MAG: helix-turn-helix transcriptional regulator [Lachnospiraceae bacterium]|nr:helix-turn-helix transcriptional regulator [Lachnospiraceae bacterium]